MERFFEVFKKDLETERLELRILEQNAENAKLVWNVLKTQKMSDFQYAPMTDDILPKSLEETCDIMKRQNQWCETNGVNWYIFYKNNLIGYQRIHYWENIKTVQCADVWIVRQFQGNGFNQEIHKKIEELAFDQLDANRICRQCMKDNKKSFNSIIKSGFHLDGIDRQSVIGPDGSYMDHCHFSKLKSEYIK
ncbi:MAG: GNAT family N-acetyltransferase [Alphaproteobacteria bacterium]|nr:GNAT family N-acetyltransferase [Alphaproteobacteria bacterium]